MGGRLFDATKFSEESFSDLPVVDYEVGMATGLVQVRSTSYGSSSPRQCAEAQGNPRTIEKLGIANFPICMAKTQKSFSDDESKIGRPTGFTITVREFEYAVGAGFIIPILGEMMRMPGLPAVPASEHMDIDNNGVITGLS